MTNSASFPPETRQLASLEARLNDDLSLQDIEEIEQQIVIQTTDKTRGFAINLFNRFEAKKPALVNRQIILIDQASNLDKKIKLLTPLIGYLDPEVIDDMLAQFQMEAQLANDPKVKAVAQKQLDHLQFAQAKPILQDLKQFIAQVKKVAATVLSMDSLAPMGEFNNVQLDEIRRMAALGV